MWGHQGCHGEPFIKQGLVAPHVGSEPLGRAHLLCPLGPSPRFCEQPPGTPLEKLEDCCASIIQLCSFSCVMKWPKSAVTHRPDWRLPIPHQEPLSTRVGFSSRVGLPRHTHSSHTPILCSTPPTPGFAQDSAWLSAAALGSHQLRKIDWS